MDADEPAGLADAAAVLDMPEDREGGGFGPVRAIQRRALAFGEAGLAGPAIEEPILPMRAVAAANGRIAGISAAMVEAVGVLAADACEVVPGVGLRRRLHSSNRCQSVGTTSGGEHRGRDNAKNIDGRNRHVVVDSMGPLLAVLVTAASVDDAAAALVLFARLEGQPVGKVRPMYADNKYHNFALYEWVEAIAGWGLEVIRRPEGKWGWVKLPIRWTVERTFAWLGRCRWLSKDWEKTVRSSESFLKLAMIQLMLHRLEPSDVDPEFRYPRPAAA